MANDSIMKKSEFIVLSLLGFLLFIPAVIAHLNIGLVLLSGVFSILGGVFYWVVVIIFNLTYIAINWKSLKLKVFCPFLYSVCIFFIAIFVGIWVGQLGKQLLWKMRIPIYTEIIKRVEAGDIVMTNGQKIFTDRKSNFLHSLIKNDAFYIREDNGIKNFLFILS